MHMGMQMISMVMIVTYGVIMIMHMWIVMKVMMVSHGFNPHPAR